MTDDPAPSTGRSARLPELRWSWVIAAALSAAALTAGTVWLFLAQVSSAPTAESARAKLDAIRTALSISVGAGGAFALWLAVRRQRSIEIQIREATKDSIKDHQHREKVHLVTELDLIERRITELYTKAVEQLGSDKAPVRLGGLYALERLGNTTPTLRQTIINVVCAYLRMPFPSPSWEYEGPRAVTLSKEISSDERLNREELQVRLAAQRMLSAHLRDSTRDSNSHWGPLDIDLSDAMLVDFRLIGCSIGKATFFRTRFLSVARFDHTTFHDEAWFFEAESERMTFFTCTTFSRRAIFTRTRFGWNLVASGARFQQGAFFDGNEYCGTCDFREARFQGVIEFDPSPQKGELDEEIVDTPNWPKMPGLIFNFHGATAKTSNRDAEHTLPEDWIIDQDGKFVHSTSSSNTIPDVGYPEQTRQISAKKEKP